MAIPILSLDYSTKLSGQRVVKIHCEECSTDFVFVMEREAKGIGTSIYGFDNDGAQQRAVEAAQRELTGKLWTELDVVPCPECGHVQSRMIPTALRRRWRPLRALGILATIAAAILGGMNYLTTIGVDEPVILAWPEFWLLAWVGPAMLAFRAFANQRYDPNADRVANRGRGRRLAVSKAEWDRRQAEAT